MVSPNTEKLFDPVSNSLLGESFDIPSMSFDMDGEYLRFMYSYHIISYHIISYHIISYHIISYHIITYHNFIPISYIKTKAYHIISYHIITYHNFIPISYIKTKAWNTTWYWGHDQKATKVWDNHALTKVSTNIQTWKKKKKKTLHIQTNKNTQEYTRHAPKWNQLYSDSKTDFSWFLKSLVVLQCFTVLS